MCRGAQLSFIDVGSIAYSDRNLIWTGNPALRQGKPGCGFGFGYGLRHNSRFGNFRVDYAVNAYQQRTVYFGVGSAAS